MRFEKIQGNSRNLWEILLVNIVENFLENIDIYKFVMLRKTQGKFL